MSGIGAARLSSSPSQTSGSVMLSGRSCVSKSMPRESDERPGQNERGARVPHEPELPRHQRGKDRRAQFDDRIARRNLLTALRALAPQQQVAHDRNVLPRRDHRAALRTARARDKQVVRRGWGLGAGGWRPRMLKVGLQPDVLLLSAVRCPLFTQDLLGLRTPFAIEHDRHAMDHDVEKAADQQTEYEDQPDPDDRVGAQRKYQQFESPMHHFFSPVRSAGADDITQENAAQCAASPSHALVFSGQRPEPSGQQPFPFRSPRRA